MNSGSGTVRKYVGCLSTNAFETGLETKHEIEPNRQVSVVVQS